MLGIVLMLTSFANCPAQDVPTLMEPADVYGYGSISDLVWAPDGSQIAIAGDDLVHLIDPDDGSTIRRLAGHAGLVNAITFTNDSRSLWSIALDRTLRRWSVATGEEELRIDTVAASSDIAMHPSGSPIAVNSNNSVEIYDAQTGELLQSFEPTSGTFQRIALGTDPDILYSISPRHGSIRKWDLQTGLIAGEIELTYSPRSLRVSADGRRILTSGELPSDEQMIDQVFEIDLNSFSIVQGLKPLVSNEFFVDLAYAQSPSSQTMVLGTGYSTIWAWTPSVDPTPDVYFLNPRFGIVGNNHLATHPTAPTFVLAEEFGTLHQFVFGTENPIQSWGDGHAARITCGSLTADGTRFVSADEWGNVQVRDVDSGELLQQLALDEGGVIGDLALCENDSQVLLISSPGAGPIHSISRFDLDNTELLSTYTLDQGSYPAFRIVCDPLRGRFFTGHSSDSDFNLIGWSIDQTSPTHYYDLAGDVNALALSPDGSLVLAGADEKLFLCDLASTVPLLLPAVHGSDDISGVAFNPANPTRAVSSDVTGRRLVFWDLQNMEVRQMTIHEELDYYRPLVYSPDGRHLFAGLSISGVVHVYDTESLQVVLQTAPVSLFRLNTLAYDARGPWLYIAAGQTVRRYDVTLPKAAVQPSWPAYR